MDPFLDRAAVLERLDGDEELLAEIIGLFQEDGPRLLTDIRAAVAEGDSARLTRAAHTLKGAVGNFCCPAAYDAALRLEQMGHAGGAAAARPALARLEETLGRLQAELAEMAPKAVAN